MSKSFYPSLVLKGIIMATILALILSLVFGFMLSFTALPESALSLNIIFMVSVFIPALIIAHHAGTKGLYHGLGIGLGFVILLLILTAVFIPDHPSWLKLGEKTILALLAGGVGGIIGVLFRR